MEILYRVMILVALQQVGINRQIYLQVLTRCFVQMYLLAVPSADHPRVLRPLSVLVELYQQHSRTEVSLQL